MNWIVVKDGQWFYFSNPVAMFNAWVALGGTMFNANGAELHRLAA